MGEPTSGEFPHTPTPWFHGSMHGDRKQMVFAEGRALCLCQPDYRALPHESDQALMEANAAFIVRAVNAHDAMLAALEAMVKPWADRSDELLQRYADTPDDVRCEDGKAQLAARAAIKLAKEG